MGTAFPPTRYKLTVDEYHKMGEAGILNEDDRIELIDGELIQMASIGARHAGTVTLLIELLMPRVHRRAVVWPQNPVTLPPRSEPQPDVMLLRPRADRYLKSLPKAADTLLLIEVSDTSVQFDRKVKQRIYARDGIPEYWIVDIESRCVEVYRSPKGERYAEKQIMAIGSTVSPLLLPQVSIDVAEIFPDVGE